jgi:PKD repeat protein
LTATDSQGASGVGTAIITVEALNLPPEASITSPVAGQSFETGVNIAFTGTGTDPEEGSLTGASLVWTSDFDGQIGTRQSFSASLSAGSHIVTLTVTDSRQAEAAVSISITVAAPVPTATPAPTATPVPQPAPLPAREAGLALSLFTGTATLNGYLVPGWNSGYRLGSGLLRAGGDRGCG